MLFYTNSWCFYFIFYFCIFCAFYVTGEADIEEIREEGPSVKKAKIDERIQAGQ